MAVSDSMREPLESLLAKEIPGFQSLLGCDQLTAGASQETYRVHIDTEQGEMLLALRRSQPALAGNSVPGNMALKTEARLLELAGDAGIPVPAVELILRTHDKLGEGYLMEWLEGETLGQRIVRSDSLANVRPLLARQCGEALARIHAIDVDEHLSQLLPTVSPTVLINETWAAYQALEVPVPMIDFSARWLLENLPNQSRQTLVHGDFRNGNLMINSHGIRAVLDWELAQIGDPVRDLGWLCVNSWRFGQTDWPVGGFGSIEDLLAGYRAISGIEINRSELSFWQVFGSFWWSVTTLCMSATWRTDETPSLERPVIGRRSSEGQMDCVNLLIPGDYLLPPKQPLKQGPQLPMPAELLEGVRKFLKEDIAESQDGHTGFIARVAANSLGIAQRELLYGPVRAAGEYARLQALLGTGELDALRWNLVKGLRGELALTTPGLAEHLRQTVAEQLAIDQPFYSALREPPER